MKKLDFDTYCQLEDAVHQHRYDWTFEDFRAFRESLDVTRETLIPCEYSAVMLEYRYLEYNPADFGMEGKYSELRERVELACEKGVALRWVEYRAHKAGRRDLTYGRTAVEKKTGAGDWLESKRAFTPDAIVREYSRKTSYIHWQVDDLEIDITCRWCELMEYLGQYHRKAGGPAMGAAYWFKNQCKASADGDRWILEIQTYRTSEKKLAYLRACPYNKGGRG